MDIRSQKEQARASIAERMQKIDAGSCAAESRSICKRIREELPGEKLLICGYFPMRTEVDLLPLLKELLTEGHTIALPHKEGRAFAFRIIRSFDELVEGPFGVPEPRDDDPVAEPEKIDLLLLPGRAFDPAGNRLGRGNGGFDIFLTHLRKVNPRAEAWGVCYDFQILHSIPMEAHDEQVDAVVTPRGLMRINRP
jgi:5-formyltetrahydrofolate cyclo-ligase